MASRTSEKAAPTARTQMRAAPDPTSSLAAERQKLMRDSAFLDKNNPKHHEVMEQYKAVTEKLYGGGAA